MLNMMNQLHRLSCVLVLLVCSASAVAQDEPAGDDAEATEVKPEEPKPTPVEGIEPVKTESGLVYYDIKVGEGETPQPAAEVTVHYSGWLAADGKLFDSSRLKDTPLTMTLNRFVPGFTEGVGSMRVGGVRRLEIPAELGYGKRGSPPKIPADSNLVFEVELIGVKNPPKPTSTEGMTPRTMELNYSMKYFDIKEGDGPSPTIDSNIKMHFSIFLEDGTLLQSSRSRDEPLQTGLGRLPWAGWLEGVLTMKEGGIRQIHIPPGLGPNRAGAPQVPANSTIVVEMELIDVENPSAAESPKEAADNSADNAAAE